MTTPEEYALRSEQAKRLEELQPSHLENQGNQPGHADAWRMETVKRLYQAILAWWNQPLYDEHGPE